MIRHAVLPVPIPAVILVTAAAMTIVRQEHLKTTPVLMLPRPSADPPATGAKTVLPVKPTGTVLMSGLPNAEAVIPVPITVLRGQKARQAVRPVMMRFMSDRPNAAPAATDVRSILIPIPVRAVTRLQAVLVLTGIIPHPNPVLAVQQAVLHVTNVRQNLPSRLAQGTNRVQKRLIV